MFKIILATCAVISTLCLLYFVISRELTTCLIYPDAYICSLLPDTPEERVLKKWKDGSLKKSPEEDEQKPSADRARESLLKLYKQSN
jgi:hypothetical protein